MPPRKLPALLSAVLLIICVAWPFPAPVEAKGKKQASRSRKQIGSSRSKASRRRSSARRGRRHSNNVAEDNVAVIPASYPIAPDRIEVIESGSDSPPELKRYLNPPLPRSQTPQDSSAPDPDVSTSQESQESQESQGSRGRRKGVNIDEARALQIQQALTQRGFYSGEMTGVYDQATIAAMRRFQASQKIPVTGYPTAHALKRLGL
ncbi:MAG: peptidoglycan-binding domain-containing protein [Blastocatellia bacterium]